LAGFNFGLALRLKWWAPETISAASGGNLITDHQASNSNRAHQHLVVSAIFIALCVFHAVRYALEIGTIAQRGLLPLVLIAATTVSMPFFIAQQNWARRLLMLVSLTWGLTGAVLGWLQPRVSTWIGALVAFAVFGWMAQQGTRTFFGLGRRNWGFARLVFGWVLVASQISLWIRMGKDIEGATEDLRGLVIVAFGLWLIWSGIRIESQARQID